MSADHQDCRTCKHNTYVNSNIPNWVSCGHPITLRKQPRFEAGDPAFVNFMTGDLPVADIGYLQDCAAYETAAVDAEPSE